MRFFKLIFFVSFISLVFIANADEYNLTIEGNTPRNGDILNKYYIRYFNNNKSGNNVIWDFSEIKPQKKFITSKYKYRNDSCFINIENNNIKYYQIKNNEIYHYRLSAPGKALKFPSEELSFKFPIKYGMVFSDYFFSEGSLDFSRYLQNAGKIEFAIIASGKMITPDGDSLRNVLLLREIRSSSLNIAPDFRNSFKMTNDSSLLTHNYIDNCIQNDSIINISEHYYWYAQGYRYPIIETRKVKSFYYGIAIDSISEAYYTSANDQIYELSYDVYNDSIRKLEADCSFNNIFENSTNNTTYSTKSRGNKTYNSQNYNTSSGEYNSTELNIIKNHCQLYPLTVSTTTTIEYQIYNGNNIEIRIFSASGALVWQKSFMTESDCGNFECDINELIDGEYIVSVNLGSDIFTFKIIKN